MNHSHFQRRTENEIINHVNSLDGSMQKMLPSFDTAFKQNSERIASLLPLQKVPEKVLDISCVGDSHKFGEATSILTTDAGKVVFKPRDLRIDILAKKLIGEFFDDTIRIPLVVNCDLCGFCEYIESQNILSEDEARDYYYKLGGTAAILLMLGARDFHYENILWDGQRIVLVDLENIVSPRVQKECAQYKDIDNSIINTCLMPQLVGENQISALFREKQIDSQKSVTVEDFQDDFFDGFDKIYRRILSNRERILERTEELERSASDVRIRFILRKTSAYERLIAKTREAGWARDKNLKPQVQNALSRVFEHRGENDKRVIAIEETESILAGDIPYFYTDISAKDLYINGKLIYKNFFAKSAIDNMKDILSGFSDDELEFEIQILKLAMRRNIKKVSKNVIEEKVVNEDKEEHEIYEIDESAKESDVENRVYSLGDDGKRQRLNENLCINYAEEIFQRILDDAVTGPSGYIYFFDMDANERSAMILNDYGYVNGNMGIALFAAALSVTTKNVAMRDKAIDLYEKLLSQIDEEISFNEKICFADENRLIPTGCLDISFDQGVSGMIFATGRIWEMTHSKRARELFEKLIKTAYKLDLSHAKPDMMSGVSGMIATLCEFDILLDWEDIREYIKKLCNILINSKMLGYKGAELGKNVSGLSNSGNNEGKIYGQLGMDYGKQGVAVAYGQKGLAHGQMGIALALHKAGKLLGIQEYIEIAETIFEQEYECIIANKENAGYCSGLSGMGMIFANFDSDIAKGRLDRIVAILKESSVSKRDHLCCGNCSIVDFLLEAGKKLLDETCIEEALNRLKIVLDRKEACGEYSFVRQEYEKLFLPSLYYGAAGVGYEFLRAADAGKIRSALLF